MQQGFIFSIMFSMRPEICGETASTSVVSGFLPHIGNLLSAAIFSSSATGTLMGFNTDVGQQAILFRIRGVEMWLIMVQIS